MKPITDVKNLNGKKVLVRADFNIPLKNGQVASDYKLVRSMATIEYLVQSGAVVILVSHLGRPKGKDKKLSLKPVLTRLAKLMQKKIDFYDISTKSEWAKLKSYLSSASGGAIVMLENIRFLRGEEAENADLSKMLAELCDLFVLDGFGVAHRRAASVTGVARYVPAYAGILLFEEVSILRDVMQRPKRPLVVLLGGAKAETKIPVLKKLLSIADHILISGGIFNTYLAARGKKIGSSIRAPALENEVLKYCRDKKVILPLDVVVGSEDGKNARREAVDELELTKKEAIYDVGPETVRMFSGYIKKAKTLIWNGAMGRFERHPYQYGTFALARLFAARARGRAFGISGGGETVEILEHLHLMPEIDLVSTGGGAMLEYLSGAKLPGLESLD